MFSKRVILIAAVLVCIFALTAAMIVQAQNSQRRDGTAPPPTGPGRPDMPRPYFEGPQCPVRAFAPLPDPIMTRLAEELKLDDQQKKQAMDLIQQLTARIKEIMGDTKYVRDIAAELKAEPTNPTKVNELAAKASKQEADILQAELAMWMKFEQVLTPEQRAKFWTFYPMRSGLGGPPPGGRVTPGLPRNPGAPGPGQPPPAPPAPPK